MISAATLNIDILQSPYHSASSLHQNFYSIITVSTVLQSHPVGSYYPKPVFQIIGSFTEDLLFASCAVLKAVAHRGQIWYIIHSVEIEDSVSFTSPMILAPANPLLSLLHQDPTNLTWQIHGHQTTYCCIDYQTLSQTTTWTPLAISFIEYTVLIILRDTEKSLCSASNKTLLLFYFLSP